MKTHMEVNNLQAGAPCSLCRQWHDPGTFVVCQDNDATRFDILCPHCAADYAPHTLAAAEWLTEKCYVAFEALDDFRSWLVNYIRKTNFETISKVELKQAVKNQLKAVFKADPDAQQRLEAALKYDRQLRQLWYPFVAPDDGAGNYDIPLGED